VNLDPYSLQDTAVFDYKVAEVVNNRGFIFKELTRSTSIKKNYVYFSQDYFAFTKNNPFDFFRIEIAQIKKLYERNYKKLQNIFADLGGIFNCLIFIGTLLVCQFNKKKFDCDVINYLIRAESPKELIDFLKDFEFKRINEKRKTNDFWTNENVNNNKYMNSNVIDSYFISKKNSISKNIENENIKNKINHEIENINYLNKNANMLIYHRREKEEAPAGEDDDSSKRYYKDSDIISERNLDDTCNNIVKEEVKKSGKKKF